MKIAVVTDSTAYLTKEQVEKYNIRVVPIPFVIDDQVYNEGVDITTEEFYDKLRTCQKFPSTTQPPVGELIELYNSLADEGYDTVISIHLAGTISGFIRTLQTTVKDAVSDRINLIPYDSKITVLLMGYLAIEAAKLTQEGKDLDTILARLNQLRTTIKEFFVVDDLQNLVRGGRLSNASAFIGSVLKIKPLLTFDDESDKIVAFEKVRSSKRALKRVEELFDERIQGIDYPLRLIVIHANDEAAALAWREKLAKKYPDYPIDISYFGPVIGTHLGEKALALAWMEDIYR
ncbi:EDD domain protein, DegV family [Ligilactobacillus sp. WC1T17]|uniref:EDD domain protein, DegV family n=1 Tax=Ligilactobacillus ruminis TaxID=1623 RepID=A0ABY1AA76_9LACO|nr:EDD domain protein, DegV family [Ligilactobacillus ruminis]